MAFKAINPLGLVPALEVDGQVLIQSPAIIEWLEETPPPSLRCCPRARPPGHACDVHPINNRRILMRLRAQFGADEAAVNAWCATWISAGFDAFEALLAQDSARRLLLWRSAHAGRRLPYSTSRKRTSFWY